MGRRHRTITRNHGPTAILGPRRPCLPSVPVHCHIGLSNEPKSASSAAIAQLGERQTEDLKVPGSIPGLGTSFVQGGQEAVLREATRRRQVPKCAMLLQPESKLLSSPSAVPHACENQTASERVVFCYWRRIGRDT